MMHRKNKIASVVFVTVSIQFMAVVYYVCNVNMIKKNQADFSFLSDEMIIKLMNIDATPIFYDRTNGDGRVNRNQIYSNDGHKFMFCFIQKNANTLFRNLWFAVERNDPFIHHINTQTNKSEQISSLHSHLHIYLLNQKEILNIKYRKFMKRITDADWIKIVIIRDPLERLLSGYLDRCLWLYNEHNISRECFGDVTQDFTFEIFVDRIITKTKNKEYISNPHYWPQSWFCGMKQHLKEFQYVIRYDYNSIGIETKRLLQAVGLSEYYYHWGPHFNQTMFEDSVHVTYKGGNNVQSKIEFYKQYYTKELAIKCLNLYKDDYNLFRQQLSFPDWVHWL